MDSQYPRGMTPHAVTFDDSPYDGPSKYTYSVAFLSDMEDGKALGKILGADKVIPVNEFCDEIDRVAGTPKGCSVTELMKYRTGGLKKMVGTDSTESVLVVYPCDGSIPEITIQVPTIAGFLASTVWCDSRVSATTPGSKEKISLITGHRLVLPKTDEVKVVCLRGRSDDISLKGQVQF